MISLLEVRRGGVPANSRRTSTFRSLVVKMDTGLVMASEVLTIIVVFNFDNGFIFSPTITSSSCGDMRDLRLETI